MVNILKWFGWERDEPVEFEPSRRLFLRKGAMAIVAPVFVPPAISYFLPLLNSEPRFWHGIAGPTVYEKAWLSDRRGPSIPRIDFVATRIHESEVGKTDYFVIDWASMPVDPLTEKIRRQRVDEYNRFMRATCGM